ncbi:hypothetical protein EJ357_12570 [Streptomyces cyaneochromogenes]|uniref:Uncharacterized protein n=1 Tax=Streptomyces cyaneochromogenes TaxID=2496836 RepID=A0A3Q9EMF8_9ACTN|nr:hypothetical protein EJ357_12570 [Streptomyces cyaneochromogenes]
MTTPPTGRPETTTVVSPGTTAEPVRRRISARVRILLWLLLVMAVGLVSGPPGRSALRPGRRTAVPGTPAAAARDP